MILFTGGSGRLGKALKPHFPNDVFSNSGHIDIRNREATVRAVQQIQPNLVVHLAAVVGEKICRADPTNAWRVNVAGTENLVAAGFPVLYASSEYVFDGKHGNYDETSRPSPRGLYGATKRESENVILDSGNKLLRFSFRMKPFPYPQACVDMWTSALYVDEMARQFVYAIDMYRSLPSILHLGGERISIYDLARQTVPDIKTTTHAEIEKTCGFHVPQDCSLNTDDWRALRGDT